MSIEKKQNWLVRLDRSMEAKKPELWKFVKWCVTGLFASLVELIVTYVLQYGVFRDIIDAPVNAPALLQPMLDMIGLSQGRGYLYTYLISITIGYTIAFILNRKTVFKANNNAAVSSIIYAANVVFVILAGAWFGTWLSMFLEGHNLQALIFLVKPIQMLIPMAWSYPLNRFIVFTQKKNKQEADKA